MYKSVSNGHSLKLLWYDLFDNEKLELYKHSHYMGMDQAANLTDLFPCLIKDICKSQNWQEWKPIWGLAGQSFIFTPCQMSAFIKQ